MLGVRLAELRGADALHVEGHHPRPLQPKATSLEAPHASHCTSTKPRASGPHPKVPPHLERAHGLLHHLEANGESIIRFVGHAHFPPHWEPCFVEWLLATQGTAPPAVP